MYKFLSKFPTVIYNGTPATNIVTRVKFKEIAKKRNAIFHPYVVKYGERPDQIASFYYKDPRYLWLIFLSNDIYDPYYDWYLTEENLKDVIVKKYGSLDTASKTILYWKVNWASDERIYNISQYEALSADLKKYWAPVLGASDQITSYRRKDYQWAKDTNKVLELTTSNNDIFSVGAIVEQSNTTGKIAQATVKHVDDDKVVLNHVFGNFLVSNNTVGGLTLDNSNSNSSISSVVMTDSPISNSEVSYWTSVSAYSNETILNESRKYIRLIDRNLVNAIEKELDILL